jgi:lysyl-tRNA synthetase class II
MTAVEWLIEQFRITNSYSYISETFKQAKEMEKQQIIDAHKDGAMFEMDSDRYAEQYYNEKYKPSA